MIEKGKRKGKRMGNSPGILIVTCDTDPNGVLAKKKPELNNEDYATCCCILQNLLLLLEAEGISAKWSTGQVWNHSEFNQTVGLNLRKRKSGGTFILRIFGSASSRKKVYRFESTF